MRRTAGRLLAATYGKARWQPFWRWAHERSLRGRNYGRSSIEESGELVALDYAQARMPEARTLFDVGANRGEWSLAARARWPAADIHTFEPSASTYSDLVINTRSANLTLVHAALGDRDGTATLFAVPDRSELSSLHQRDLAAHQMEMKESETVSVLTIDTYCASKGVDRIDYLKIDTEGHEVSVLAGARRMIECGGVRFIQFEFGGTAVDARIYLHDFFALLTPQFRIMRLLSDALEPVVYSEREEILAGCNFLAESVTTN